MDDLLSKKIHFVGVTIIGNSSRGSHGGRQILKPDRNQYIIEINITTGQRRTSSLFYKHVREVDLGTTKNNSSKRLGSGLTLGLPDCNTSALTLNHAACMQTSPPDLFFFVNWWIQTLGCQLEAHSWTKKLFWPCGPTLFQLKHDNGSGHFRYLPLIHYCYIKAFIVLRTFCDSGKGSLSQNPNKVVNLESSKISSS